LGDIINVTADPMSQLNRASNTVRYLYERTAAAYFSPCTQFVVAVDLTP
jgi:hypothetical protein